MMHPRQDTSASSEAWADYWRSGALHSCATSFRNNYGGNIAAFWHGVFSTLQPGNRVLDIATGNGALPQLLIGSRPDPGIACDAVDLAPIAPSWLASLPGAQRDRLQFFGGTQVESLPFEPRRFALAVSQYGIEYTDLQASLPELLRVLARPARLALLVHHTGSRPVSLAQDEVQHIDWLLEPEGLLALSRTMLHLLARASTAAGRQALSIDPQALACRERFNTAQQHLTQRAAAALCPDVLYETRESLAAVLEVAARADVAGAGQRLEALVALLQHSRTRLADLLRCALDAQGVAELASRFAGEAPARIAEITEAGWLMGWTVQVDLAGNDHRP